MKIQTFTRFIMGLVVLIIALLYAYVVFYADPYYFRMWTGRDIGIYDNIGCILGLVGASGVFIYTLITWIIALRK